MVIGDEAVSAMYQFLDSQKQELDLGNGKRIFKYVLPQGFPGGARSAVRSYRSARSGQQ